MLLRTLRKRAALAGTGLLAASLSVVPLTGTASAAAPANVIGDNDAVNVQTEYDCSTHSLSAEVTNKLNTDINPSVYFDQTSPDIPGYPPDGGQSPMPIKPGEHQRYLYGFSGHNQIIPVQVSVDGHSDVKLDPMIACQEPVSFQVTQYSPNTVVGYLTNNNFSYPQTVTLSTGLNSAQQNVTLQPGESTLVSVPFHSYPEQQMVLVTVSNGPGFQSSYSVDLTKPLPPTPVVK